MISPFNPTSIIQWTHSFCIAYFTSLFMPASTVWMSAVHVFNSHPQFWIAFTMEPITWHQYMSKRIVNTIPASKLAIYHQSTFLIQSSIVCSSTHAFFDDWYSLLWKIRKFIGENSVIGLTLENEGCWQQFSWCCQCHRTCCSLHFSSWLLQINCYHCLKFNVFYA